MTEDFADLTIDNANLALSHHPQWAWAKDIQAIRKYTTIEEFINSTHNKWAEYYTL